MITDEQLGRILALPPSETIYYTKAVYDRFSERVVTTNYTSKRQCEKAYDSLMSNPLVIAATKFVVRHEAEHL